MPEIRPTLNKIPAFDAKLGTTLSFSWAGAQSQKNRIVIREYTTNKIVYDCTQKTMALKHTLHILGNEEEKVTQTVSYKLKNGMRYLCTVYVYDVYDTQSLPSNEVGFYCFSTPTFKFVNFTNINLNNIAKVTTNSIYPNVKYVQTDGEVLNEYKFILYSATGKKLDESNTKYGSTADDNLVWTLGGIPETEKNPNGTLNYGAAYKIVCEAVTVHGMEISTEQKFVVQKDTGGVGALLTAEKLPDNTVSISCHFKITNSELIGEEKYIQNLEGEDFAIDLTEGQTLSFFEGFVMNEPWAMNAFCSEFKENTKIISCENNNGDSFSISYCVKRYPLSQKAYFLFESVIETTHYLLSSDYLPIEDKWYGIYINYKDGYYTFKIYNPEDLGYIIPQTT